MQPGRRAEEPSAAALDSRAVAGVGTPARRAGAVVAVVVGAVAVAAAVTTLVAAGGTALRAQDAGRLEGPPELGALPRALVKWPDPARSFGGLEISDLETISLAASGGDLVFQADFQRPLVEGMFTNVEAEYDCDGRRIDIECGTRSSVGSRYRPTAFVPRAGAVHPIRLVRSSWLSAFDDRIPGERMRRASLVNRGVLVPPDVGGRSLRFRVPKRILSEGGTRGATTPPAIRLFAITTCGDHPLVFDYDALAEPRAIRVDGAGGDWSGGPYIEDAGEELHEAVRHMDLRSVWCDHGADAIYLRVDFDQPGFGSIDPGDDVSVLDELHVELQPRGDAYMDDVRVAIRATRAAGSVGAVRYATGPGLVEIAIPRDAKQTKFRVAVWSQAERIDHLAGDWLELPAGALR